MYPIVTGSLFISLIITILITEKRRRSLIRLSVTDALTGLLNRAGLEQQLQQYMSRNQQEFCVGLVIDIDNFKQINDMYGHDYGDLALQQLARDMQASFTEDAILARSGGDEFCIILKNGTGEKVREPIEKFAGMKHEFFYEGVRRQFTISVGYAECCAQEGNQKFLLHNADVALYEVKLRGKQGCLAYKREYELTKRQQLGFNLKDVMEMIPCGILIVKEEENKDEILYVNREAILLAGCRDREEFAAYSKQYFHNLLAQGEAEKDVLKGEKRKPGKEEVTEKTAVIRLRQKEGTPQNVIMKWRRIEQEPYGTVRYITLLRQG